MNHSIPHLTVSPCFMAFRPAPLSKFPFSITKTIHFVLLDFFCYFVRSTIYYDYQYRDETKCMLMNCLFKLITTRSEP